MKKLIFTTLLFFLATTLFAQTSNFLWAKQLGGEGFESDIGHSIAVDANGNVYTTGEFSGTADFDPGPGIYNMTTPGFGIFVSKLDASGNFLWAKQLGGVSLDNGKSIAIDVNGNVYITGYFGATADFDPGLGIYNLSPTDGYLDVFISKLDASGNFLWAKQLGGTSNVVGNSIAVDASGNVYTTGYFYGTADFDPGSGTYNLNSTAGFGIFVSKLDAFGNFLWAKQLGASGSGIGFSIAVDASGNVYTTGRFSGTADFDPSPATYNLTSGSFEIFISKLNSFGNFLWAKQLGGVSNDIGYSIAVDANGNVYTTGEFSGTADFDPGPGIYNMTSAGVQDIFVSKLNSFGNFLWAKQLGGVSNDIGYSIAVDTNGNVYTTGEFSGTADFDPSSETYNLVNIGDRDIFVSMLDASGNFVWAKKMGGTSNDVGNSIAIDASGNVYTTGYFRGTVDFDPGPGTYYLTSAGGNDIFITKFKADPKSLITPQITLSKSIIQPNQNLTISGQSFTPNGAVFLNFFGIGGRYNTNIIANSQGSFTYSYSIPANAKNGIASVTGFDSVSGKYSSPVKSFEIQLTPPNTSVDYLNVSSPKSGDQFSVGQDIHIDWSDKLQRNYGNYYYPVQGTTAYRLYRYRIEYQVGVSGTWQLATTVQDKGLINSNYNHSEIIHINASNNACKVRVVDDYAPTIVKTTETFSIIPAIASNLKADLIWDNSFPTPAIAPQGVAADGVSRLYIKITKQNQSVGPVLQQVFVTAKDGTNNSPAMLGKLQEATDINIYSTQANNANAVTANSSLWQSGNFWFWYVAPDDFAQSDVSSYANISERTVTLHIEARYDDNSIDIVDLPVNIVRPPLVMAHGIASSDAAWQLFHYDLNNADYPFIISPLFKVKNAINLYPHYSYAVNALQLLSPNGSGATTASNRLNSLQGNIDELRQLGYAANQVDYICHSMGGSVLRTAMSVYENKFYGKGGYSNDIYKSYGKGFVHKAITINTPHNNTPVADAVTEFIPQAPWYINLSLQTYYGIKSEPFYNDFIQPANNNLINVSWQATDAVKDLQVNNQAGGKDLALVTVKNHLIAGDVDIYDPATAQFFADMEPYLNVLDKVLDIMEKITLPPAKQYLQSLQKLNKVTRVLPFIEWYSEQKDFPNFLGDGDIIVPLSSQLAGLNVYSPNVSIFKNTSFLNSFHTSILNRTDVGNKVKLLLNSALSSSLFGNVIPATNNSKGNFRPLALQKPASLLNVSSDSIGITKVEITAPLRGDLLFADSTVNIRYNLKDTVGLAYIDINFQSESNKSFSRSANQIFSTQVDPNFTGKQLIFVTAVYEKNSSTQYYTDTLTVNIQTTAPLLNFKVSPQTSNITNGLPFYPGYIATYDNYIAAVPYNSPGLSVMIADPTAVQYDTALHAFIGLSDTYTTYAVIDYKGHTDTIYFINTTPLNSGCINRTIASGKWNNPSIWEKGIVPGTCDSVVILSGHIVAVDTTTQINALYISAGATLSINDSTINLQVGATDDGRKNILNNGTLNITKGKVSVNGRLQQNAGSTFNMKGGVLVIDGNTGYSATSVANGQHLFDVSNAMVSFSFTSGTLQIIDPPLGNISQAINCNYNFGDSSILKLGDGISTTVSNNPNGFGGNLLPAQIGSLIFDATTKDNNRIFINLNPLTVKSPLHVLSGNLVQGALLKVIQ